MKARCRVNMTTLWVSCRPLKDLSFTNTWHSQTHPPAFIDKWGRVWRFLSNYRRVSNNVNLWCKLPVVATVSTSRRDACLFSPCYVNFWGGWHWFNQPQSLFTLHVKYIMPRYNKHTYWGLIGGQIIVFVQLQWQEVLCDIMQWLIQYRQHG